MNSFDLYIIAPAIVLLIGFFAYAAWKMRRRTTTVEIHADTTKFMTSMNRAAAQIRQSRLHPNLPDPGRDDETSAR